MSLKANGSGPLWGRLNPQSRSRMVWGLWFATEAMLVLGYFPPSTQASIMPLPAWDAVVIFSGFHAVLFACVLFPFQVQPFPVQVRVAYLLWVAVGTYCPYGTILMHITTVGNFCNLFLNYCPLARIMTLMPWNRRKQEGTNVPVPLTFDLVKKTFLAPPSKGKFEVKKSKE